jgi:hypothetical protein
VLDLIGREPITAPLEEPHYIAALQRDIGELHDEPAGSGNCTLSAEVSGKELPCVHRRPSRTIVERWRREPIGPDNVYYIKTQLGIRHQPSIKVREVVISVELGDQLENETRCPADKFNLPLSAQSGI